MTRFICMFLNSVLYITYRGGNDKMKNGMNSRIDKKAGISPHQKKGLAAIEKGPALIFPLGRRRPRRIVPMAHVALSTV